MAAGIALAAAGAAVLAVKAVRVAKGVQAISKTAKVLEESVRGATNVARAARYAEHLRQAEKYGQDGVKFIRGGRVARYYGKLNKAEKEASWQGAEWFGNLTWRLGQSVVSRLQSITRAGQGRCGLCMAAGRYTSCTMRPGVL
jgi:hypothetical protein